MKTNLKKMLEVSNRNNQQVGATLIEAMVSLFIFAVGALGIAAMQTTSLVKGDDTRQRSLALWKAQELADRIRITKTANKPEGLIKKYADEVNNDGSDIGTLTTSKVYECPADPPKRCDDINGTAAAKCNVDQIVKFDVWSVMCDPNSGVSGASNDGSIGLRDVELAIKKSDDDRDAKIYFEWVNRDSSNKDEFQTSTAETIDTDLCGENKPVDVRLDVYCLRL